MAFASLFDEKLNECKKIGDHFLLSFDDYSKNQVDCAVHNYNNSKKRNQAGKRFSRKKVSDGWLIMLVEFLEPK